MQQTTYEPLSSPAHDGLHGSVHDSVAQIIQSNKLQAESNRLERAQLDSHLEEVMMGIDRYFATRPRLRKFFFVANARHPHEHLPTRSLLWSAMGTAELIIDFADDVGAYAERRKMDTKDVRRWSSIVGAYFDQSPITRFMWCQVHDSYESSTAEVLHAPFEQSELDSWDWRTNSEGTNGRRCNSLHGARTSDY